MQFDDATLGGGLEIRFDPTYLRFDRFVFDPVLGDDPSLRIGPAPGAPASVLTLAFGSLDGLVGELTIGEVYLASLAALRPAFDGSPRTTPILLTSNLQPAGPFVSASAFGPLTVQWVGATVQSVPEPAAGTLLAVGFAGLALSRRSLRCAG